ncbi:MAG: M14 family zinc carboxypeptidase [Mangrovibacterium sp.]
MLILWGKSLGGLNLYRLTITDASNTIQKNKKWVHYFTNPHPGEHNAQWRMMGMIEWLLSDQGDDFRRRSICHFILMMSPDAPHKGWYRVNGQGIDMNRSYSPGGVDKDKQAHEAYIFQKDLELIMTSESPVTTLWGMHTWAGIVEPLVYFIQDERLSTWTAWRDILLELDQDTLIKPLALREKSGYGPTSWEYGAHTHLGITTILCEGGRRTLYRGRKQKFRKIIN